MHVYFACIYAWISHVCLVYLETKRALDPLELEFYVGVEVNLGPLDDSALNHWAVCSSFFQAFKDFFIVFNLTKFELMCVCTCVQVPVETESWVFWSWSCRHLWAPQ